MINEKVVRELDQLTAENYVCPRGEEGHYHVKAECKKFDANTGERVSRPVVLKFNDKEGREEISNLKFRMGYDVVVLHDPIEYAKLHKERVQAAENARRESEKLAYQAELSRRDGEIDELKRQIEALKDAVSGKEEKSVREVSTKAKK